MMKKNVLFWMLAGLGFGMSAVQAQEAAAVQAEAAVMGAAEVKGEPTVATVGFSTVKMALSKGKVRVTMNLDFSKLKIRGEYYFTPHIADGQGHELRLSSVLMATRNFYLLHQRARDLSPGVRLYESKTVETVDYEAVVDYEPWMKTAVLYVEGMAIPVPAVWEDELQDVSATSLVSGLAAALAQDGDGAVDLPEELQAMTLTPEMQAVLTEALKTIAQQVQQQTQQTSTAPQPAVTKRQSTAPQPASAQTQPALAQPVFEPVFVYRTPADEPHKLRTEKGTAHIAFRLNGTGIDPSWRGNRAELDKIKHTLEALANDADYTLKAMAIKGYASPEGAYDVNAALAAARMEAVKTYVRQAIDLPAGRISTAYEAEDWNGLRQAVEASNLPHKADILRIMADASLTPDAREDKIKERYPADYADMFSTLYPALRHVDYVVEYEVRAYADPAEIVRLLETQPQKLSLQEMYRAARTMVEGSEAYDEVFETAVRLFPADETANLNAANSAMRWRDLNRAERYLAKAGQSPEAVYARGNCAALRGNYEAAASYFKQAADRGVSEATVALERIMNVNVKENN